MLPDGVDAAAFRIVQEALTNVIRHAGPATATVRVAYGEHGLTVEINDDGHGLPVGQGGGNRQGAARHAGTDGRDGRSAPGRSPAAWGVPGASPPAPERHPMIRGRSPTAERHMTSQKLTWSS